MKMEIRDGDQAGGSDPQTSCATPGTNLPRTNSPVTANRVSAMGATPSGPAEEEPPPLPPELRYEVPLLDRLFAFWNRPKRLPFWWHLTTRAQEVAHWSRAMDHFQTSSLDFYARVQKTLDDQRISRMPIRRVLWKEAGIFSAERLYLRVTWNRYVGDICAAPFGRAFFFSFWVFVLPPVLSLFHIAGMTFPYLIWEIISRIDPTYRDDLSLTVGIIQLFFLLVVWVRFSRQAVNTSPLTDFLLGLTFFGPFIEIFFRRLTYFERDTAAMFLAMIENGFFEAVDEVTKSAGERPLSDLEKKPELAAFMHVKNMGGGAK